MKTIQKQAQALHRRRLGLVKLGELGGDGQDIPFEQAFSNLAHAYLRDKAPTLLDHEQGFQLLDRNQDNTKAIGVFGFKVGSHQLYAPVFFLQGDLKGHELLYLKNQDLFCPLKENWLNYILNRKPNILGESVDRNTGSFGVRQPELNRLALSPHKFASAAPPWLQDAMPKIAHTALTDSRAELEALGKDLDLGVFLKQASLPMLEHLVGFFHRYPKIAQAFDRFHGMDTLHGAIKEAGLRARAGHGVLDAHEKRAAQRVVPMYRGSILDPEPPAPVEHPIKTGELKVITYDATQQSELPSGLDEKDQEKLLKEKLLIKDHRNGEQVSVPYDVQVQKKLFNPNETGLYMVLVKPGEFEKCFVAIGPHGADGRKSWATLVRVEGEHDWCNAHPSKIWCCSRIEDKEYRDWWEGLKSPDSLSQGEDRHVLIGQRGNATVPFKVKKSLGDANGDTSYEVDFSDCCEWSLDKRTEPCGTCCVGSNDYDSWRDGQRIHLNGKDGTSMRSHRGDVWIPKGAKLLNAKKSEADSKKKNEPCCMGEDAHSKERPLRPGNYVDAELGIMVKTSALKLHYDGHEFSINNKQASSPLSTVVQLVRDHGFRENTARELMKRAMAQRTFRCRVKYATPYLTQDGPTAPNIPDPPYGDNNILGASVPTQSGYEDNIQIPGMSAALTDRSIYNPSPQAVGDPMGSRGGGDGGDAQKIDTAMQTGQKEVFDTAMIGSMLKAVRDDTMIDRYLPELVKGMDRLGRVLFMFYWHGDKFADRYGKQDMPELEDSLRNAFEMMGDVILFLKQKTIEPYPEEQGSDNNLQDAARA